MFVITADQIGSRAHDDIVDSTIAGLVSKYPELQPRPERTAGDELQLVTPDAQTAFAIVLSLCRTREWSVGLGIGPVREPLPDTIRRATGEAFYAARDAVARAKKAATRFAASGDVQSPAGIGVEDAEALIVPVLMLRDRRTDGGWEIADLLESGLSQREAAATLQITPGAASLRVRAAGIRADRAASAAIVRLLASIDSGMRTGDVPLIERDQIQHEHEHEHEDEDEDER